MLITSTEAHIKLKYDNIAIDFSCLVNEGLVTILILQHNKLEWEKVMKAVLIVPPDRRKREKIYSYWKI